MTDKTELMVVFALLFLMFVVIPVGACAHSASNCDTLGEETGRATRWSVSMGCRIEQDGKFIPVENWRTVE